MGASLIATTIDAHMLDSEARRTARGGPIAARFSPIGTLPLRSGPEVAVELCGRPLLRYALVHQVADLGGGSSRPTWVTPTPYAPPETVSCLALPAPDQPREYVILLDPSKIDGIHGPHWIVGGSGIEYYLPNGYQAEAILPPGFPMKVA